MVEIYEANLDLDASLDRIEGVVRAVVEGVLSTRVVTYQQRELDFSAPFRRVKVLDSLDQSGNDEAKAFAVKHRSAAPRLLEGEDLVLHRLIHEHVKPSIVHPTFLTHFPKSADQYPDRFDGNEVHRAELVVSCMEVGEIGALQPDWAVLQQHATAAVRDRHGHTATTHLVDVDYLAEIKAFNQAVGGGAIGIDRLLMLLCDSKDMREVVWYPLAGRFHEGR
jgi:lysyl-tRNA synthetase class 2